MVNAWTRPASVVRISVALVCFFLGARITPPKRKTNRASDYIFDRELRQSRFAACAGLGNHQLCCKVDDAWEFVALICETTSLQSS